MAASSECRVEGSMSVLSQRQWGEIFSGDVYQKVVHKDPSVSEEKKQAVRRHSLKYLIALDQSDASIFKFIESLKNKRSPQLNSPFSRHQVTALHIAVMKNREAVVKALIKAGANVYQVDKYGWTPLHHAALVSDRLVQELLKCEGLKDQKTLLGGDYENLMCLTGRKAPPAQAEVSYMPCDTDEVESFDEERLGVRYIDDCLWPKEMLYELWTRAPKEKGGNTLTQQHVRSELYPTLSSSPVKMTIKDKGPEFGVEVLAAEDLEPFRLIGQYTGKITKQMGVGELTYSFIFEQIEGGTISVDAAKEGNWTRFMNDGFPNVIAFNLFNTAGQKWRKVFFVADPDGVRSQEPLLYDYNWTYFTLKWGEYKLMGREKMRKFFSHFDESYQELKARHRAMQEFSLNGRPIPYLDKLSYQALESRLLYPFQTPMALMDLVFSQVIDPQKWDAFIQKEKQDETSSLGCVFNARNPDAERIEALLQTLIEFNHCIRLEADLSETIRNHFIDSEDKKSVDDLIRMLGAFNALVRSVEEKDRASAIQTFLRTSN